MKRRDRVLTTVVVVAVTSVVAVASGSAAQGHVVSSGHVTRAGVKQTVDCRGNGRSCQARVSIAAGASDRTVIIRLTDTDFKLASVKAYPSASKGAYSITRGHFALAGSEYVMTLNAVSANPRGAHLILRFITSN